jgi:protocatechuate 3,4-dioxygenase beta subunit
MRIQTVTLLLFLAACSSTGAQAGREPVIGGPCEGCEWVFDGMPATLDWAGRIAPPNEPGTPMRIDGVVRDRGGKPAAGIIVYAYQTDAGGLYPAGSNRHGRLKGWVRTDANGRYRFDTVRPGGYPSTTIPQHVHMHVIEPGRGTYYIDDIVFTDDPAAAATAS